MIKVLRDKSANLKRLKSLQEKGLIQIHEVDLENLPKYSKNVNFPLSVSEKTKWDHSVWADDNESVFDNIMTILGNHNINDAISLESAVRYKCDYFVTEDIDEFIGQDGKRREYLHKVIKNVRIVTPLELEKLLLP